MEAKLAPESDMLPNHLSLSKYKEFYNEICESIPRYRWDIYSDKWYEYIAEHFISCSSNGTNLLFTDVSKMFADLTRGTVSLVASRPLRGEIPFFTSLFYYAERCGRKIDIWDLYGDTEFLKDTRYSDTVTVHDAVTDIYDILTSGKDIIILYGIQAIQKEPFNPEEMNEILSKFKALSHDLNSAVIVYSGLPRECDTYSPDLQDIERFGIPSYVFDYIAVLNGRNVRLL